MADKRKLQKVLIDDATPIKVDPGNSGTPKHLLFDSPADVLASGALVTVESAVIPDGKKWLFRTARGWSTTNVKASVWIDDNGSFSKKDTLGNGEGAGPFSANWEENLEVLGKATPVKVKIEWQNMNSGADDDAPAYLSLNVGEVDA